MSKLIYGKNRQVQFLNEEEKLEAFEYLINSTDIEFRDEQNQHQGAWGPEKRIYFYSDANVPERLKRNWTGGTGNAQGRINCAELYDEVLPLRQSRRR
ncbi:hypothetical protein [Brevibacterium sp. VCM10]|uniref:hypothetical protein n=1 Tax=Brevibacterium sp. VCM10 TaxID=1381751 RepID=UPI0009DCD882|nr:hypothetical protein [Brevibacterium sp. VCM10]